MSAAIDESDEVLADRRDQRHGETFMATFAAIGALLLLDSGKADAALPDPAAGRPTGEWSNSLRGSMASPEEEISGPPAVSDSAFLEAIAALSPPPNASTDWPSSPVGTATPDPIAPPDDTPSAQPGEAEIEAQFTLPGAIIVVGSAQISDHAGGATRTSQTENNAVFAVGNDTINVLSGPAAAQSVIAGTTLGGVPTPTLGGLGHPMQGNGYEHAVGGPATSVSGYGVSAGAADRLSATSESTTPTFTNPASLLVADIVIDLSALFAFGVGNPGASDLFAVQASGAPFPGGDMLSFLDPDLSPALPGIDKVGIADFAARGQIRLP